MGKFWTDDLLKQWILPKGNDAQVKIEEAIFGHVKAREVRFVSDKYTDIFNVYDGKTSVLLTHISVMIAINSLWLTSLEGREAHFWEQFIPAFLIFAFGCLAFLSLRLLRFWASDAFDEALKRVPDSRARNRKMPYEEEALRELENVYQQEVFYRDRIYRFVLRWASFFTFVSVLHIVWVGANLDELIPALRELLPAANTTNTCPTCRDASL